MTQDERQKFESLHSDFNKYWIPCVWFTNLAAQARRDGRIRDDVALRLLIDVSCANEFVTLDILNQLDHCFAQQVTQQVLCVSQISFSDW